MNRIDKTIDETLATLTDIETLAECGLTIEGGNGYGEKVDRGPFFDMFADLCRPITKAGE